MDGNGVRGEWRSRRKNKAVHGGRLPVVAGCQMIERVGVVERLPATGAVGSCIVRVLPESGYLVMACCTCP